MQISENPDHRHDGNDESPLSAKSRCTTESVIEKIFRATLPSRVLCLGDTLPPILLSARTRVVIIGSEIPGSTIIGADSFDFRRADSNSDLLKALADYAKRGEVFDLVFIDHDHRIHALIEQVNALSNVSHEATILLFDDAVPPTFEMANDEPGSGWWVGSVWILPRLHFFESDEHSICVDSSPTGLYAVMGRPKVNIEGAHLEAQILRSSVVTIDDLRSTLTLATDRQTNDFIAKARNTAPNRQYFSVDSATNEDFRHFELSEICPEKQLVRPIPQIFADLSEGTVEHHFDTATNELVERQTLVQFRDSTLIGTNAIFDSDVFYCRYTKECSSDLERIASERGYANEGTGIFTSDGVYRLPKSALQHSASLRGRFLLATPDERDNWGMWLLVTLPSVAYFLKNKKNYDGLICFAEKPWQRLFLRTLGVQDSDVISHDVSASYNVERLDLLCRGARNLCVTDYDRDCYATVAERLIPHGLDHASQKKNHGKYRKIFISRLSSSHDGYRMLAEEAELIRRLEAFGFTAIEPQKFSFAEQVWMFRQAEVIVGLGGAGMFNTVFAMPGTTVVTIEGSAHWVHSHANLFTSCDLELGVILGREDRSDVRPIHRRWNIDVTSVLNALSPLI